MANWKKVIVSGSAASLASLTLDTALPVASGGSGQSSFTNGQLLIGNTTGNTLAKATLTQGGGGLITNGTGTITVGVDYDGADNVVLSATDGTGLTIASTDKILVNDADDSNAYFVNISQITTAIGGGTVTSVSATGTENGLTLTADNSSATVPVITLGGALADIANSQLTNSSVSYGGVSVSLGSSDATPAFDLSDATSLPLTTGISGVLPTANGGTNISTYTTGDILYSSASNTLAKLGIGSTGQVLAVSAAGIVEWTSPTTGDLESVANATNGGIDVTNGTGPDATLAMDINNLAEVAVDVAADFIAFSDEGTAGDPTKKESIADLITAIAGTGLTATSGVLSANDTTSSLYTNITGDVSITAAGVSSVNSVQENSVALTTDTTGNYVQSLAVATNGGITVTNGSAEGGAATVTLNVTGLSNDTIASGDRIAFSDEGTVGDPTKNGTIDTVATLFAGVGLTATDAVIAVDYGSTANTAAQGNTSVAFQGTTNEVDVSTNFTTIGGGGTVTYGLPSDVTIANNLTVANNAVIQGDLRVSGTASFTHSDNLDIADKFITLSSGSTSAGDGGIIVAQTAVGATQVGEAFGFNDAAGGAGRWGITSSLSNDAGAIVPLDYMVTARATALPASGNPHFGGSGGGYGNIHVDTNLGDVYIYV